ncbi:MAG TPA: PAS domain S-box protein, partial [Geobacteraceae bacterium]
MNSNSASSRTAVIRIVAIYAAVGGTWIYTSDTVLGWLVHDPDLMVRIAIFKGGLFILVTSLLLYFLFNRHARQLAASEQTLRSSERSLQTILESEPECVKLLDADGNLLMINRAGLAMLDADSLEQIKGHCVYPLLIPHYRTAYHQLVAEAFQGETGTLQFEAIGLKGRHVWLESRMVPFRNEADEIVAALIVTRDITEQTRMAHALRESEERYRTLFEQSADGIMLVDPQSLEVLHFNEAAHRNLGYTRDEFAHLTLADFEARDDLPTMQGRGRSILETGSTSLATVHRTKQGELREVEVHFRTVELADKTLVHAIIHDVTESKRAEQALRNSEQRYRTVVESTDDLITRVDPTGRLLFVNAASLRYWGAHPKECIGRLAFDFIHPDDREATAAAFKRWLAEGTDRFVYENRQINSSGEVCYLLWHITALRDEKGAVTEFSSIARDITDRRLAEESLKASEVKFRSLVESSFDVIFVLDTTGVFQFVSPAWEKHFGYAVSEVVGRDFRPFVHPDDAPLCAEYLVKVLSTGRSDTSPPYRVRHADGTWRLFMANGTPYTDASGALLYLGVGRDISQQKQAEEERLSLERQLLHSQKLESLGVLAGGIAHDFNNILAAIIGNLDLTLMDLDPSSPEYVHIERAMKASRRAADLTRQMLAFSGRGLFLLKQINLNDVVRSNAELFRTTVPKTVSFIMDTTHDLPLVEADPGQIQQVVMNLITNAAEAIGNHPGTITLTTGVLDCDENCLEQSRLEQKPLPGLYAYLEVADSGCGMTAETQQRIFEPFYTTKFTGRGLGMAAVLGIIKAHRGAIILESELGKGS